MLEYDSIGVLEGIDVSKTNGSRECIICQDRYFMKINSKFQPEVCDGCYRLMEKAVSFNDVAIVIVKVNDSRIHFLYVTKDEVINLLRNAD